MDYFYGKLFRTLCLNIVLLGLSLANQGSIFYQVDHNTSNITLIPLDIECPIEEFTYLIVSNATEDQQEALVNFQIRFQMEKTWKSSWIT